MAFYSMHEGAGLASERAVPNAGGRLIGQRCGTMLERCGGKKWPGWPFGVDKYRNETILLNDDGSEGRVFRLLLRAIAAIFTPGTRLIAESLCLRQQLLVLQRQYPRRP